MILSFMLLLGLGATQINAQVVNFGVKAEANTSNFILTDMDGVKSKLGFGATFGGFAKINAGENFAIQPELLFHFKSSEMETKSIKEELDYQYFGIEIPVYAVGQMELGAGTGYIGIGPYLGLGFDARYKKDNADDVKLYKEYKGQKSEMQCWDFGAGAMLGYEFNSGFQINGGYKIGFIDALNANKNNATMLPQTVSLGLGFRF